MVDFFDLVSDLGSTGDADSTASPRSLKLYTHEKTSLHPIPKIRQVKSQFSELSELESVRIGKCQN